MLLTPAGCWEEVRYESTAADAAAHQRAQQAVVDSARAAQSSAPGANLAASEPAPFGADRAADDFANDLAAKLASTSLPETPAPSSESGPSQQSSASSPTSTYASTPEPVTTPTAPTTPSAALPAATAPEFAAARSPRRVAWLLGNKLSLSALANDRGGAVEETGKLFSQAQTLAQMLGTTIADLPSSRATPPTSANFDRSLQYLFTQGQSVGRFLATKYGDDHAALFELAVKSNLLLALYRPHSSVATVLASAIEQAGGRSGLPVKLWQPLMDALAADASVDDVRHIVYQMHSNVDKFLSTPPMSEPGVAAQSQ
jgi:hypothetical protein